mmetsp:Transcript_31312/g.105411  ORF Transcript_31312/g.105411 Transcript_31312/m.105411 type:complete len:215 (+) Transcript_31312:695-1339(+)
MLLCENVAAINSSMSISKSTFKVASPRDFKESTRTCTMGTWSFNKSKVCTASNNSLAVMTPSPSASNKRNCCCKWPISASVSSVAIIWCATFFMAFICLNCPNRESMSHPYAASALTFSTANQTSLAAERAEGLRAGSFCKSEVTKSTADFDTPAHSFASNFGAFVWIWCTIRYSRPFASSNGAWPTRSIKQMIPIDHTSHRSSYAPSKTSGAV